MKDRISNGLQRSISSTEQSSTPLDDQSHAFYDTDVILLF